MEQGNGERQIIDGQQRITSLFLLLRAVFSMLENIGNKLPLEKKLNISASNNYFDKKPEDTPQKTLSEAEAMIKKLQEMGYSVTK